MKTSRKPFVSRSSLDTHVTVHRRTLTLNIQLPGGELSLAIEDPSKAELAAVKDLVQRQIGSGY